MHNSNNTANAVQTLKQSVCQQFGWSLDIECTTSSSSSEVEGESGGSEWVCTVTVGLDDTRQFRLDGATTNTTSTTAQDENHSAPLNVATAKELEAERKRYIAAVAAIALEGLSEEIAKQIAKPTCTLNQVFPQPIPIFESSTWNNRQQQQWQVFWKNPPSAVGIDTEGNRRNPPVLVQIATDDYTIVEAPPPPPSSSSYPRRTAATPQQQDGMPVSLLSPDLLRLLNDKRIVKVFCDNFDHCDKRCLGILPPTSTATPANPSSSSDTNAASGAETTVEDWTVGPIVDLEALSSQCLGRTKSPRGLTRILSLCGLCPDVTIRKPTNNENRFQTSCIKRFCLIEQGKAPPLRSIWDLNSQELQYAALDAWCTLQAYKSLCDYIQRKQVMLAHARAPTEQYVASI